MPPGKARRRVAAELISDLERIYQRKKAANKELTALLKATGTTLTEPARDRPLRRRPAAGRGRRHHPVPRPRRTSPPGTAPRRSTPPPATRSATGCPGPATGRSTGCCTSWPSSSSATPPKAAPTTTAKSPPGRHPMEAMRALKRRLSDIVYHQMITDARGSENGPGRTPGDDYWLQRGRLAPQRRHFGEVTSRTRHRRPYARKASPFSWPLPALSAGAGPQPPSSAVCLTTARTGAHYPGRE